MRRGVIALGLGLVVLVSWLLWPAPRSTPPPDVARVDLASPPRGPVERTTRRESLRDLAPNEQTVTPTRDIVLAGQVILANGDEAAGATIFLTSLESGVADEHGWFSILVDPGRYTVAGRLGEACGSLDHRVYVGPDKNESIDEPILLVLDGGRAITGAVRDERGRGIADASIALHSGGSIASLIDEPPDVRTDREGRYRIGGVCGAVKLVASAPTFLEQERVVASDDREPVDFSLKGGASIRGRVVDGTGAPVPRAGIRIDADGVSPLRRRLPFWFSEDDGRFVIEALPAGAVTLSFSSANQGGGDFSLVLAVGETREQTFVLSPGASIAGRVVDASGQPLGGVLVSSLESSMTTGPDGRFVLRGVRQTKQRIEAVSTEPRAMAARELTVDLEHPPTDLEIVLRLYDRALRGRVVYDDGNGAPDVSVLLSLPETASAPVFGTSATTDRDGKFVLEGLPPGMCALKLSTAFSVVVESEAPCDSDDLVLRIPRPASIAGTVTGGARGGSIAVRVDGEEDEAISAVTLVDGSGRFKLAQVTPGRYLVVASDEHGDSPPVPVTVRDGEQRTGVHLTLPPR